jgi:hypothetical protein
MLQFIIPAALSFLVGMFGYLLYRLWFVPVRRYGVLKREVGAALARYTAGKTLPNPAKGQGKNLRTLGMRLADCYNNEMPPWFRIRLAGRGVDPVEASRQLLAITGSIKPEHARQRIERARAALKMESSD